MTQTNAARKLSYPAGLLIVFLLGQLLLLTWSAFPEQTMRSQQPRESWAFLVGFIALFASWTWPLLRSAGRAVRQSLLEAGLLAAAGVPAAVTAIAWVDASWPQIIVPAGYAAVWLLVGAVAVVSRPIVRWGFCLLATLVNFGLLGAGYLCRDLLSADAWPMWRLSPMVFASELAVAGWPGALADQLALFAPAGLLLALLAILLLARPSG